MFARCLDTGFAHLAARDSACIDIEYISWVRYHYGISVYCYRYPLEPVQPFYRADRKLTIPEVERTTRILNDGNGFRSDRLKRCVYGERDSCTRITNDDDSCESGIRYAVLDNPLGKYSKDCYLSSQTMT